MEESALIIKAEKFLNKISKDSISLENIEEFDNFKELYYKLESRLEKLQNMKDQMDAQGYKAPFRSLSKYGTSNVNEVSIDEMGEISRHNQFFRMKATAKRNILDRVKSAIDSHKIALGNLEEFGKIKCNSCYKTFLINEFDGKCTCGCEDLNFKVNNEGNYRLGIIPYLPLSGNYMVLMSQLTSWGRESFKKVLNILKQERKGVVKTISLVVKYKDKNNRLIRKNINLDSDFIDDYEEEVRRRYGKNVRIELIRFHRTKPAIINDKHTRNSLALAYVQYCENLIGSNRDLILKKKVTNFKNLKKYFDIKEKYKNKKPKSIDDLNDIEKWRDMELKKTLRNEKLCDRFGKLNITLKRDIKIYENLEKLFFMNLAPTIIIWDMFKYFLTTSFNNRRVYVGPFPYLRGELDRQQRKVFESTNKKIIEGINKFTKIKIIPIKDKDLILYEKFKLEKEIKNANIKFNYPALGGALVSKHSEISIEEIGNAFNVNTSKIKKEKSNIEKIRRPKNVKSKIFLEMIKK